MPSAAKYIQSEPIVMTFRCLAEHIPTLIATVDMRFDRVLDPSARAPCYHIPFICSFWQYVTIHGARL